jgi:hypothetical protein
MLAEEYNKKYWYEETEKHGDVYEYGTDYYAYKLFDNIITQIKDIPDGKIVVMGTHNCVSFDLLCKHFGYNRCIGYDIANPTNHPNVIVKNVMELSEIDYFPIAFVHNDIGNFQLTPAAKLHAQKWAANCVVEGGYFLGRTNINYAKYDLEGTMKDLGFVNFNLQIASTFLDTSKIRKEDLIYHMLSKKVSTS